MGLNPYEKGERLALSTGKSREIEAWALFELAKRLEQARTETPEDKSALLEVMRLNWRVWTLFQSSLLDEQNPVEADLRGNLLTLCAFIDKHSSTFLTDPQPEKLQILININKHLGHGLRGNRLADSDLPDELKPKTSPSPSPSSSQADTLPSHRAQNPPPQPQTKLESLSIEV